MAASRLLFALLLALAGLGAAPASADIFLQGRYTLAPGDHGDGYSFTAEVPETVGAPATVVWPEGCTQTAASRTTSGGRVRFGFDIECERPFTADDTIATPWLVDGGSFESSIGPPTVRAVTPGPGGVVLPVGEAAAGARPFATLARIFTVQGILHIWLGWDHLAFVFLMSLVTTGRRRLALITGFTLGHSVSLAAAFLEYVRVPMPPVEAIIALSIAFMAREVLVRPAGHSGAPATSRDFHRQLAIVSAFGLLHGLGFASALGDLGVLHAERLPALFFFNIGVEIGQLLFVAALVGAGWLARDRQWRPAVTSAATWAVGLLGGYWVAERVAGFAFT